MTRQNFRRGLIRLVLSALVTMLAVDLVLAQAGPSRPARSGRSSRGSAKPPASQPLDPEAQEKLRKLMEMSPQHAVPPPPGEAPDQKAPEAPAAPSKKRPERKPAASPGLDELNRRARASTQKASAPATPVSEKPADGEEDDFFGPPYPPATPTIDKPRAGALKTDNEKERAPTPRTSSATDDMEWFNFEQMPWEDVVRVFADRLGKPLLGFDDLVIGGELTYSSDRKFTKEEALDELNLLMHMQGYRFVETEHHIEVVPLSEMGQRVPVSKTYPSRSAFEEADPPRMDYVIVYLQIEDVPARKVQYAFETMFSDDFNIFTLEDSNQLKLTGAAQDVHKFLDLMDRIDIDENDPRQMRIFQIQTNARDIERMVREILDLAGGGAAPKRMEALEQIRRGARGRAATPVPAPTPSPSSVDTEVRMSADDRTNTLIVRATPDKLERIAGLIEQIDKRPELEFYTQVTEIKYANATEVAELLNKILSLEQNQPQQPDWQRLRQLQMQQQQARGRRGRAPAQQAAPVVATGAVSPEDLLGEGLFERVKKTIRIAADERSNSLIVYANKDGHERVLNLLKEIDRALPTNLQTIQVEHAQAAQIYPTVNQIVQNLPAAGAGRRTPSIVLDEAKNQFYVLAERDQLQQIQEVVQKLDVPGPESVRHMVSLTNIAPSRVAQLIEPILTSGSAGSSKSSAPSIPPALRRLRGMRGMQAAPTLAPTPQATQADNVEILALDEAMLLIVVCPEELWAKVEDTIYLWDEGAVANTPRLETIPIEEGDPQSIAATLNNLYRGTYTHPVLGQSQVIMQPEGRDILVYAIQPAIDEITTLIAALDHEDSTKYEIFPLANADAATVAQQAQALFGGSGATVVTGPRSRFAPVPATGGSSSSLLIQAEPTTNSLIMQGEPVTLAKVKQFALEADQRAADLSPIQKIFAMQRARAAEVAQAVQNAYGGQRQRLGGTMSPTQVRAFATGAQVVVEAPKEKMEDIASFIAQLDSIKPNEIQIKAHKLPGVDVIQMAQNLSATARTIQRPDGLTAVFIPDAASETLVVSAPGDMMTQVDEWVATFGTTADIMPVTIEVQNADPNQVAQAIREMYGRGGRNPQQDVQVTVSNGMLVVKTGPDRLKQVRELVAALDAENNQNLQIKTYQLKIMNAMQVAAQVQMFLRSMSPGQRSGMQPGAFAEPATNTLVVIAPEKQLPMIEALIAKVESSTGLASDVKAYDLKHARAEAVAQNLDQMLKAKVAERDAGRQGAVRTAVFSDINTNRLFVLAPQEYQDLAARLVEIVDTEAATTDVVHIITLEQGDAQQIAQTLSQLIAGNRQGSGTAAGKSGTATVRITADPGSNSILLAGMPKDLGEVEQWIRELEVNSSTVPELQIIPLKNSNAVTVARMVSDIFAASGRGRGSAIDAVTITPDEYHNRLLVTTNKRKMRQVEATIAMLDAEPEGDQDALTDPSGRKLYFVDIGRGDAWDIAYDVRDMFPDEDQGGPSIKSDWFGEYITVRCRPHEIEPIVAVIRQFEAHAKPEKKVVILPIRGPVKDLMGYLEARHAGELMVEYAKQDVAPTMVETLWEEGEEPPAIRHKRDRQRLNKETGNDAGATRDSKRTDVRPFQLGMPVTVALLSDIDLALLSGEPAPDPAESESAATPAASSKRALPPGVRCAGEPEAGADQSGPRKEKPRVVVQPDGRSVIIYGDKSQVEELEDTITLLEEDLNVGEVVRIFEFKYGDVSAAAEVIQIMFNERPQLRLPQQPPQQRGQRGDKDDDHQSMIERLMGGNQRGQRGGRTSVDGQRVRIATDPGHNYLIIKCNQADLPEIKQLLRELDIPPGEVDLRIFQLRNLVASETAEDIKAVLGIAKAQQKRGGAAAPARRGAAGGFNPQAQLIEMLQQQAFSVPGVEGGAKVEQVEVVPNDVTNSLLVSAPPEVMKVIEKVIGDLENLEGREIVGIYEYQLEHAKMEDILPLLQDIFAAARAGGGGPSQPRAGGGMAAAVRGRSGGSPGSLGPVTVSGDPRVNKIIFTCEKKDEELVRAQIQKLDIEGALADAELYVCKYGDALAIADTVQAIFGSGAGGGGQRPGRGGGAQSTGSDIRIAADAATNTIVVFATPDKRDAIFAQIQALDEGSMRQFREIAVVHADPVKLADTLLEMFGGAGSAPGARQAGRQARPRQSGGSATGAITIMGDKASKKLLVRAPQAVFVQIEEMAAKLDVPHQDMQLRRYALQYANAEFVVEQVESALAKYLQMAGLGAGRGAAGGDLPIDPFTAVPDPRTNSIMVVGSPQTFTFVETVLRTIDVETPADQMRDFRVFVLDKANAEVVATAINDFAAGGASGTSGGGARPSGTRRPGGMPGGAASGAARHIDVYAFAEPTTNTVMVSGRSDDIDLVQAQIIDPLEEAITSHREIATIPVTKVKPTEILAYIWDFMDQEVTTGGARAGDRGGSVGSPPKIIPNDNSNPPTLVVHGSKAQIREITELVERFDNPDIMVAGVKLIPVPIGQNPVELAEQVERLFNDGEQLIAEKTGRPPRAVRIAANEQAKLLMLYGDSSAYGTVESVVNQITKVAPQNVVYRVIEFKNISAEDAQAVIDELQGRGSGRSSSGAARRAGYSGSGRSGGGSSFTRPGRPPSGSRGRGGGTRGGGQRPADDNVVPPAGFPFISVMMVEQGAAVALVGDWAESQLQQPQNESADDPQDKAADQPTTQPRRKRAKSPSAVTKPAGSSSQSATEKAGQSRRTRASRARPASEQAPPQAPAAAADEQPKRTAPRKPAATAAPEMPATVAGSPALLLEQEQAPAQAQPGADLTGITGELRGEVVAQPLDSKRIIVSGDAGDLDFLEQVLAMMDVSTPAAIINVFQLQYAKASALAPIIEKAVTARIETSTARPGPGDKFSINAEARSNSLIVSASETIMAQIAALIEQLDVEQEGGGPKSRNVVLQHARASEAVASLKPILEKLNNIREVPKESQPSIEAIDRSNSILVIGTPKDLDEIEELIHTLDIEIPPGESFVAAEGFMIQLKNGRAEDVAKVINDMIKAEQDAATQGAGGGGSKSAGKPYVRTVVLHIEDRQIELNMERPIRLVAEKGTNSLIIFSSPKNNDALKELVAAFDTLPVGADTEVRAIALKYAAAKQVSEVLEKVFKEGKKALARPTEGDASPAKGEMPPVPPTKTGEGLPYNLIVQSDERSNTVIVVGRKDAVLLAAGLIAELDRPSAEFVGQPFVIQLKRYPASQLEEKLSQMLEDRAKAVGGDQNEARDSAILMADDRSNSLVVLASREMFDMIEDMATQLDALDGYSVVDMRYRRLEYADAEKLANMLQELFKRKADAQGKQAKDFDASLEALADVRSNGLLLVGTRDFLAEAETLIDNLDQKYDPTVVFHIRPVKLNSAVNIAGLLKDMVDKALKEQDSKLKGTPIYVAADPISDSLLLAASQEDMDRLEGWVNWLDRPSELGRMIRIIPMRHGSADKVSKTVGDLYKNLSGSSSGGGKIDVSVTFDATTNSVVAFAPPAILAEIENSVRALDQTDPAGGTLVRIFNLEQADAQSAGDLLTSILSLRGGSVGGSGGGRGGTSGGASQEQIAKQVMLLFQRENPDLGIQTLKALRGDVSVVSDLRTNSLVITAPAEGMALMEALVQAIDVPPNQAKVRVFPLRNADAEQMVNTLTDLFQQKTGGSSGGSRSGSQSQETLALSLGESVGGQEQISFTTDMRTNSVIAAGTRGYLDLVEQLVLDLDSRPVVERKTRVYAPRNMVAKDLADAIKSYSDSERDRLQELGDDISLAVKQEAEIGAIPYEQSNRIILAYSPRKEEEVLDIVRQLDQQPAQVSIEVLIVEVACSNSLELGVEWAFQDLQYAKAGPADTTTFDYVGGTDVGAAGAGLGGFTFTITGRDFNFLLHALQSENSLNVLSRPHIVAMDNQEAKIEITDSIPYVTGSATTIGGSLQTSVSRQDVGIKLEVTPQINPDGFVRMEIRQEVSDLSDSTISVGPGVTAPIFNQRIAETVVTVQDNETVVLGGLIQSRDLKSEQKVPLLGDIPLLGPLFRFQNDDVRRAELLVILTPRVIRTREEFHEISVEARDQNCMLPEEIKCNPLMRGLRVRPEDLAPSGEGGLLGPFPNDAAQVPVLNGPSPEEYGPVRPESAPPNDLDTYNVPTSMLMKRRS